MSSRETLYPVVLGKKWGYIDVAGSIIVPTDADDVLYFAEGLGGAFHGEHLSVLNTDGAVVGACEHLLQSDLHTFSEGLLSAHCRASGLSGYVDQSGRWVLVPTYSRASEFRSGIAVVSEQNESRSERIVDHSGNWQCSSSFFRILTFDQNARSTLAYQLVEANGKKKLTCFLIDKKGKRIGNHIYTRGYAGREGSFAVSNGDRWGVIGEDGAIKIPFSFHEIGQFWDGIAAARGESGELGFINCEGHWIVHPKFASAGHFAEGLCHVAVNGSDGSARWGFVDPSGEWVVSPQFAGASPFQHGIASVGLVSGSSGDELSLGYIDRHGDFVWTPSH